MKKNVVFLILLIAIGMFLGCSNSKTNKNKLEITNIDNNHDKIILENNQSQIETKISQSRQEDINNTIEDYEKQNIEIVDYKDVFDGINGCAVIYETTNNKYNTYNIDLSKVQVSPYSTFKIVATLIGLHSGVISDENSKMNYSKIKYPVDSWNKDLSLKEAFSSSCIWYFRQVIDKVGQDKVKKELEDLDYGNCDVSKWEGSDINPMKDLNGFWLESSLKISPIEQVEVLKKIFELESVYSKDQVDILKTVMLYDKCNNYDIYGKTGTTNGAGWYVGICEKQGQRQYFAIYLEDIENTDSVSGALARKITLNIFSKK